MVTSNSLVSLFTRYLFIVSVLAEASCRQAARDLKAVLAFGGALEQPYLTQQAMSHLVNV